MPKDIPQTLILGSSLGARLAAVLLARQGQSVRHVCPPNQSSATWEFAPPLLVRFLDLLDARTCLRPARPLAILTPLSRLELHGSVGLKDELQRELGKDAAELIDFLDQLQDTADKLTETFWDQPGVPDSLTQRALLPIRLLRQGLTVARLQRPAAVAVERQLSTTAARLLATAVAGCSLSALSRLSYAELALAWTELASPQMIAVSALNDLLSSRFQSAGGIYQPITTQTSLEFLPGKQPGVVVAGDEFPARQILIGDGVPGALTHIASLKGGYGRKLQVTFLEGHPAEILPGRIVSALHGSDPLQLCLAADPVPRSAEIRLPFSSEPVALSTVTGWLEQLLPFTRLELTELNPGCQVGKRAGFPGRFQPFQLSGGRFWNVSGASLFPTLLNTGECLAAMTLAKRLAA